jgi:ABC-2 type transport system permease protein
MTTTPSTPPAPAAAAPTVGVLTALYRLVLRTQARRGRLLTLGAIALVGVLVAVAIASAETTTVQSDVQTAVDYVDAIGLGFILPITALVFSAAALGDFREDGSLVYLWLRPVARWKIVAAATAASISVALPLVLVPLLVGAAIIGGADAIGATLASVVLGVVTYTAIFVAVGLRTHRALLWGLVYVLLWEGFISRAAGAARLSVSNYLRSVLAHLSDTDVDMANASLATGVIVPLVVSVLAFAYASRRFQRQDVA